MGPTSKGREREKSGMEGEGKRRRMEREGEGRGERREGEGKVFAGQCQTASYLPAGVLQCNRLSAFVTATLCVHCCRAYCCHETWLAMCT